MEKAFVYGMSVEGNNFTDRIKEAKRIKLDFENGINVILISPRRMGKTSLVKKVMSEMDVPQVKTVYMDIYDCRSEYDFYNRFASAILKSTGNRAEQILENIKRFLVRLSPKFSFSPEPNSEFSLSLGITPKDYTPEEILNLPELIAREKGFRIVVCIDEFQQVGEFPGSIEVQKRMRGVWQHQQNVSYCLFGSKKHLMMNIFQSKRMPFYMFGEMIYLDCIPTEYWVPFICSRFEKYGKRISDIYASRICECVGNYSSYVQQLAWNVMAETDTEVTEETFHRALMLCWNNATACLCSRRNHSQPTSSTSSVCFAAASTMASHQRKLTIFIQLERNRMWSALRKLFSKRKSSPRPRRECFLPTMFSRCGSKGS